jgi:Zn-dependent peptidase ImmA (M78 family)
LRFRDYIDDGISFRAEALPPIFVMNSETPADRYRHSLAHELGHMVLQKVSIKSLIYRAHTLRLIYPDSLRIRIRLLRISFAAILVIA